MKESKFKLFKDLDDRSARRIYRSLQELHRLRFGQERARSVDCLWGDNPQPLRMCFVQSLSKKDMAFSFFRVLMLPDGLQICIHVFDEHYDHTHQDMHQHANSFRFTPRLSSSSHALLFFLLNECFYILSFKIMFFLPSLQLSVWWYRAGCTASVDSRDQKFVQDKDYLKTYEDSGQSG